ncbi:MAG: NAD-glutamate dehydrogenase [Actinobacteria bacterium]|nr:NAD-glutamate dehydrogenase [Actinomycetota bacterium]
MDETAPELPPVLRDLLDLIQERVLVERRDSVASFARSFTRRLNQDELAATAPEDLFDRVTSAFSFVDERGLEPIAVRVFDPGSDADAAAGTVLETNTDDAPFLVDSVSEELSARGLPVRRLLHPVRLRAHARADPAHDGSRALGRRSLQPAGGR